MFRKFFSFLPASVLAVGVLAAAPASAAEVQWFGQSAFKITSASGKVIVIDPFITKNPKTPAEHKARSM